ncbi:hypothetical protein [Brachybacterium sacelli]
MPDNSVGESTSTSVEIHRLTRRGEFRGLGANWLWKRTHADGVTTEECT